MDCWIQSTTAEGAARLAAAEERLRALKANAEVADSESGSEGGRLADLEEAAARLPQLEAMATGLPDVEHRAARAAELEAANAELRAAKVRFSYIHRLIIFRAVYHSATERGPPIRLHMEGGAVHDARTQDCGAYTGVI